jgi:hypothetical protein
MRQLFRRIAQSKLVRWPFWRRLGGWIATAAGYFPLTPLGITLLAASALAVWVGGILKVDLVFLMAGVVITVITAVLLILVMVFSFLLARRFRAALARPTHASLETGTAAETGFAIRFPTWIPGLRISWTWRPQHLAEVSVQARAGHLWETAHASHRFHLDSLTRRITIEDPLGLARISWVRRQPADLIVYPQPTRAQRQFPELGQRRGEDNAYPDGTPRGDRVDYRQYAPGDRPGLILWKLYARSERLMVRTPERALSPASRQCVFLFGAHDDEPVAGFARFLIDNGHLGEQWRFGASGSTSYTDTPIEARRLLARNGNVETPDADELVNFAAACQPDGYGHCLILVARDPARRDAAEAAAGRLGMAYSLWTVEPPTVPLAPRWRRWMTLPPRRRLDGPVDVQLYRAVGVDLATLYAEQSQRSA